MCVRIHTGFSPHHVFIFSFNAMVQHTGTGEYTSHELLQSDSFKTNITYITFTSAIPGVQSSWFYQTCHIFNIIVYSYNCITCLNSKYQLDNVTTGQSRTSIKIRHTTSACQSQYTHWQCGSYIY
jgi:hypothetical protein